MHLHCDGAGWDGKRSRCVVWDVSKNKVLKEVNYPKKYTNNEMEYAAVIYALQNCNNGTLIKTDSQLVAYQISGKYKARQPAMKRGLSKALELMKDRNIKIIWIPREQNLAGIYLDKTKRS